MAKKRLVIASLLPLAISGCGTATDDVLAAVQDKNPNIVGFRDVHADEVGSVCGKAIDSQGRIDRFVGHEDGAVSLESEMNAAILKAPELGAEFADVGPRLKAGFLRDYEECMASGV